MRGKINYFKHKKRGLLLLFPILILIVNLTTIGNNNNLFSYPQVVFGQFFFNENKQPMLTYENQNFKFKISYPNTWERSSTINNEFIFIAPKETDSSASPAGLVVKIIPLQSKNISVGSISNALISQLKKEHKDFKQESSGQFIIDGKSGRQIVFTATDNNFQNRKALQIVTMDNNNIFIITYKALPNSYTKYENIIKEMISSFKFLSK
jgi:hypothetical protein